MEVKEEWKRRRENDKNSDRWKVGKEERVTDGRKERENQGEERMKDLKERKE